VDDFAVFLRGAGFVFLLFVLFFVFLFPEETFLASFEEGDVPDGEDEDCARIREEIGKRLIFFFPFFTLFFALVFLARALEDFEEYDEQHVIVVISKLLCNREYYFSLCLSVSFIIKYYYTCLCVLLRERHKKTFFFLTTRECVSRVSNFIHERSLHVFVIWHEKILICGRE